MKLRRHEKRSFQKYYQCLFLFCSLLFILIACKKNDTSLKTKCSGITCGKEQTCNNETGQCVTAKIQCGDIFCEYGFFCNDEKQCVEQSEHTCKDITCGLGQTCDSQSQKCVSVWSECQNCKKDELCDLETGKCLAKTLCSKIICTTGNSCDEQTGTCVPNIAKTLIGTKCTLDNDCNQINNGKCLLGNISGDFVSLYFETGYCSIECGIKCPENSICMDGMYSGVKYCAQNCTTDTDCADQINYSCQKVSSDISACLPLPQKRKCIEGKTCGDIGSACTETNECGNNLICRTGNLYPDGYCTTSFCEEQFPCPENSICSKEYQVCFKQCNVADPNSCRAEYGCRPYDTIPIIGSSTCTSDIQCGSDGKCNTETQWCYEICNDTRPCHSPSFCSKTTTIQNDEFSFCVNALGYCISHSLFSGCKNDTDCGVCENDSECKTKFGQLSKCDPVSKSCQRACSSNNLYNCFREETCNQQGLCQKPCQNETECNGAKCISSFCQFTQTHCDEVRRICLPACTKDEDCLGSRCNPATGSCLLPCDNDEQCGPIAKCDVQSGYCKIQ